MCVCKHTLRQFLGFFWIQKQHLTASSQPPPCERGISGISWDTEKQNRGVRHRQILRVRPQNWGYQKGCAWGSKGERISHGEWVKGVPCLEVGMVWNYSLLCSHRENTFSPMYTLPRHKTPLFFLFLWLPLGPILLSPPSLNPPHRNNLSLVPSSSPSVRPPCCSHSKLSATQLLYLALNLSWTLKPLNPATTRYCSEHHGNWKKKIKCSSSLFFIFFWQESQTDFSSL